jgi:phage terminase small subunit
MAVKKKKLSRRKNSVHENEELTEKQKIFCQEYILDWNGSRAARVAGYSEKTAKEIASENLTKPNIKSYIEEIQKDIEKVAGISRLMVLNEHKKLAFSSIAHMHNTWVTRKKFESLTNDRKSCIAEIVTQCIDGVDYVKIKLYDKQKALDSIAKMLGHNEPDKIDHSTKGEKIQVITSMLDGKIIDLKVKE